MCLAFVLPVDGWNPALSESAKLWMVQKSQTTTRDVTKPCKWWDKLATPTGFIAGFLLSTVWNGEGGEQVLTKNQNKSVALSWKPMSSWMSLSFQQFLWKVAACFLINVISHTHKTSVTVLALANDLRFTFWWKCVRMEGFWWWKFLGYWYLSVRKWGDHDDHWTNMSFT